MKRTSFILLLGVYGFCHAEPAPDEPCSPINMDSQAVYECSKLKVKSADTAINKAYKELNKQIDFDYGTDPLLGEKLKGHIKQSQRAWIKLRDENCTIESFIISPESQAFEAIKNYCLARESDSRSEYLKSLKF
ncbi:MULTISPECIES: lysozyme inhibitor LprI family protein [unclassified Pseudomonas]|uniref:lysozyme inhibitor LprI family protein n=1 Tax=unclassified Pseudomonas TaxID=196821 RepID=UPI0015A32F50|nr:MULTISPECIES: lysozyme inhibitor LprI family protein [unclassified Pseudomonas]NWC91943.1 DUF1311 domain-containing protein [Pseudomonas sp. IPO3779]NWD19116.1 DUF1311 domain-containing protein [Pseudomonas sp. IPO3778]